MSEAKDVIASLLATPPTDEISSDEQRTILGRISEHVAMAPEIWQELRLLYEVKGFSDFAVSLMWIAQQTARDPLMASISSVDTTLVFSLFRRAVGERARVGGMASPEENWKLAGEVAVDNGKARSFSVLLEQFVEAVQAGDEICTAMLEQVVGECDAVADSDSPEEYKQFSSCLAQFLSYILKNQLLDDIRVLNILSNVPLPVAQWADAPPEARAGLLEEEIEVLRDFKSHFE